MRLRFLVLPMAGLLAACAAPENDPGAAVSLGNDQERACALAVAAHVGKAPGAVTAVMAEPSADGTALVNVTDGGRLHSCAVDADLRVIEIRHPGA
jgi:hypothetical protein